MFSACKIEIKRLKCKHFLSYDKRLVHALRSKKEPSKSNDFWSDARLVQKFTRKKVGLDQKRGVAVLHEQQNQLKTSSLQKGEEKSDKSKNNLRWKAALGCAQDGVSKRS